MSGRTVRGAYRRNRPAVLWAVLACTVCLWPAAPFAARDPLFGDLPGYLEIIDEAREQEQFSALIRSVQARIASESSISGVAPGGFSYEVGPLGLPKKTSSSLGTIWTSGADPVGRGRLSIGASYTYLEFDSFNGQSLDRFLDTSAISPALDVQLELSTQILGLSTLYGMTDDWEVGTFVPFVFHRSRGDIYLGNTLVGDANGHTEGLGDVMLLSKYRLASGQDWTWSLGGRLKVPTGDEDRHLGTGETDVLLQCLLTKRFGNLETNLDVGYRWNGYGRDFDAFSYRAGFAYGLTSYASLVGELIGSHSQERIFDTVDGGCALKVNPSGGIVLQAGVRFPLDDDGLRADVIPNVGLEWRF